MSSIQKLYTGRVNQNPSVDQQTGNLATTFVGEEGRLWYNPDNNTIRVYDGNPGGQSITVASGSITFGDFQASGNTMSMINPNEDMNLEATGSGDINLVGNLHIHTTQQGPDAVPVVTVLSAGTGSSGLLTVNAPVIPVGNAAVSIIGSSTGNAFVPTNAGTLMQLTNVDNMPGRISLDSFGTANVAYSNFAFRQARGTVDSPLAVQAGDLLSRISTNGYGTTGFASVAQGIAHINTYANENFTDLAHGTRMEFRLTPNGSASGQTVVTINGTGQIVSGNVNVTSTLNSTSTTTGAIVTAGGAGFAQDIYVGGEVYTGYVGSIVDGLTLQAGNGSGNVTVLAGQFDVKTTSNPRPVFAIQATGTTEILAPTFDSALGALNITGSADGNSVTPNQPGTMLHITGQDGAPSRIFSDGINSYAAYIGRRFNGNVNIPTAIANNDIMTRFAATSFPGGAANTWPSISSTRIEMVATGDQTVTNQGSRIELWTTPSGSNVIAQNITIDSNGITFAVDGSVQNTAGIPLTQRGNALGVATLDSGGKVPLAQLPAGATVYVGTWDASTNTPTLNNSSGPSRTAGYEYAVSTGGTVNFGAGNITFNAGDFVIYSGSAWERIPTASGVTSFNTRTGAVVLSSGDVGNALGYTAYNGATNPNGYVNSAGAAAAAPVQTFNTRIGNIVLATSDVTTVLTANTITNTMLAGSITNSKLANSSLTVNGTSISLGGSGTVTADASTLTGTTLASNVVSSSLTSVGTLSALSVTGNVNGGNLRTAGQVSATGNITGGNVLTGGIVSATGNITGGNVLTGGIVSATGNITGNYHIGNGSTLTSITGANVTGTVDTANTATNLTAATSILAGQVTVTFGQINKNGSVATVTATITGLTASHKIVVTPHEAMTAGIVVTAAYYTSANTMTVQAVNVTGNNITPAAFSLNYFAWV